MTASVLALVGSLFPLGLGPCGLLSINANGVESGCCDGIITNAIMLHLVAIAIQERIMEISDMQPNWWITVNRLGEQNFTQII